MSTLCGSFLMCVLIQVQVPAETSAVWPGLEGPREGPVEIQAAFSANHRELFCFVYGMACQDVAGSRLLQYPSNVDVC
jgi:hypothetical protein